MAVRDGEFEVVADVLCRRGKEVHARCIGALRVIGIHVHGGTGAPAQPGVEGETSFEGPAVGGDPAEPCDESLECGLAAHDGERTSQLFACVVDAPRPLPSR